MFYALKVFSESLYYSQEDEAIIVYQLTPNQFIEKAQYEPMDHNDDRLLIKANFVLDKMQNSVRLY